MPSPMCCIFCPQAICKSTLNFNLWSVADYRCCTYERTSKKLTNIISETLGPLFRRWPVIISWSNFIFCQHRIYKLSTVSNYSWRKVLRTNRRGLGLKSIYNIPLPGLVHTQSLYYRLCELGGGGVAECLVYRTAFLSSTVWFSLSGAGTLI